MSNLTESIIDKDLVNAKRLFESRMEEILERKLCEAKKMLQAESVGGLTKAEIEARRKAGYKKAADILPDPREGVTQISGHKFKKVKKKVNEDTLDEDTMANVANMMKILRKSLI